MRIGTFRCGLFGHVFHGQTIEYFPHYLESAKNGSASVALPSLDFHMVGCQTNYCVRCGISLPKD